MTREQSLANAIIEVMAPGREYTRDDIWNRLNDRNKKRNPRLRLVPDDVKSAITALCHRKIIEYDQVSTLGRHVSIYRRAS